MPLFLRQRPFGSPPRIVYDEVPCQVDGLKGPCHVFRGCKSRDGYGCVNNKGKTVLVHRYVWELANGPILGGLEVDHRCRNKACCNVDHLRVVTHRINTTENSKSLQAINAAKTHCIHGHPFSGDNLIIRSDGGRKCRECARQKSERNNRRNGHKARGS